MSSKLLHDKVIETKPVCGHEEPEVTKGMLDGVLIVGKRADPLHSSWEPLDLPSRVQTTGQKLREPAYN